MSKVGKKVHKLFEDDEWYSGTVESYEEPYYHIKYDDGDSEDMEAEELELWLQPSVPLHTDSLSKIGEQPHDESSPQASSAQADQHPDPSIPQATGTCAGPLPRKSSERRKLLQEKALLEMQSEMLQQRVRIKLEDAEESKSKAAVEKQRAQELQQRLNDMEEEMKAKSNELSSLQSKFADMVEESECSLCMEEVAEVAFLPCGHCFCGKPQCPSSSIQICPFCQAAVKERQQVFMPKPQNVSGSQAEPLNSANSQAQDDSNLSSPKEVADGPSRKRKRLKIAESDDSDDDEEVQKQVTKSNQHFVDDDGTLSDDVPLSSHIPKKNGHSQVPGQDSSSVRDLENQWDMERAVWFMEMRIAKERDMGECEEIYRKTRNLIVKTEHHYEMKKAERRFQKRDEAKIKDAFKDTEEALGFISKHIKDLRTAEDCKSFSQLCSKMQDMAAERKMELFNREKNKGVREAERRKEKVRIRFQLSQKAEDIVRCTSSSSRMNYRSGTGRFTTAEFRIGPNKTSYTIEMESRIRPGKVSEGLAFLGGGPAYIVRFKGLGMWFGVDGSESSSIGPAYGDFSGIFDVRDHTGKAKQALWKLCKFDIEGNLVGSNYPDHLHWFKYDAPSDAHLCDFFSKIGFDNREIGKLKMDMMGQEFTPYNRRLIVFCQIFECLIKTVIEREGLYFQGFHLGFEPCTLHRMLELKPSREEMIKFNWDSPQRLPSGGKFGQVWENSHRNPFFQHEYHGGWW